MHATPTALPGGPRLVGAAAIAVAAAILGGGVAVLLGVLAVMLALDAVIPMPGRSMAEADDRFAALVRRRRAEKLRRRLRGLELERLDVLDDRAGWASVAERRALGIRTIDLASIRGTVEPAKAAAFDRAFRPQPGARERWTSVWVAWERGSPLAPIAVFRVGDAHYVRDGHHRVSVARAHGVPAIDADVVELRAPGAPWRHEPRAHAGRSLPSLDCAGC